jgi:spermidine/putrescine transport system permease protein
VELSDRMARRLLATAAIAVYVFLYFPMVVLVVFAFATNTTQSFPIEGFTLNWFDQALHSRVLLDAFRNSVLVGKRIFQKFVLLPLILPGVVTGVAFQSFYALLGLPRSLWLVTLAHGTALTSTVLTTVYGRLLRFDRSIEEASMDLGVDRLRTFWKVTLPNLRTSIIAAALLAFTLSFDEIPVTIFITGDGGNTLPMVLWSTLRRQSKPEYVAFTVLVLLLGICVVALFGWLTDEDNRTHSNATPKG